MLEANTDRMWFTIGSILIGASLVSLFKNGAEVVTGSIFDKFDDFMPVMDDMSIPSYYVTPTDDDFVYVSGSFKYTGSAEYVIIPATINGQQVISYSNMFEGTAVKGVATDPDVDSNVISSRYMFRNSTAMSLDLRYLDTSNVTTMLGMFTGAKAQSIDVSSFDTAKVRSMASMFMNTKATKINLNGFNTSNVTSMNRMFSGAEAQSVEVSSFDTSKVADMVYMFNGLKASELDLSSFDTSGILSSANMDFMFANASIERAYARNNDEVTKFNNSGNKADAVLFRLK